MIYTVNFQQLRHLRHVDLQALPLPPHVSLRIDPRGVGSQLRGAADLSAGIVAEVENPTGAPGDTSDW